MQTDTAALPIGKTASKERRRQRGVFEKVPGSSTWWIRYTDAEGRFRREKAGTKSAAIDLYRKRKTDALIGKKLPEKLRRATVTFADIARDAWLTQKRTSAPSGTMLPEWRGFLAGSATAPPSPSPHRRLSVTSRNVSRSRSGHRPR